jgi:hypothetical protein
LLVVVHPENASNAIIINAEIFKGCSYI